MGIESPQTYIKTRYKDRTDDLMMLKSCCIGQSVISEIEANVEDTVVSQTQWIDIMVCKMTCGQNNLNVQLLIIF